uniref:60S ribosomal protein L28 n=1 Tax=Podarcis muralis TaxID=64176 RepID=A0A670KCD6_PODMU
MSAILSLSKETGQIYSTETNRPQSPQLFPLQWTDSSQDCWGGTAADGRALLWSSRSVQASGSQPPLTRRSPSTKMPVPLLAASATSIRKNNYHKDLRTAALRRASAILRSQKPVVAKKKRTPGYKGYIKHSPRSP